MTTAAPDSRVERALIGSLLLDPEAFAKVSGKVAADDLVEHRHRVIFRAVESIAARDLGPDAVLVADELQARGELLSVGGIEYLTELLSETGSAANVANYARAVSGSPAGGWPAPIDLRAMLATPPTPPRMVIDDWLPCGYATLFAAHGGAGKSSIALHLATCIELGRQFFGLHCSMRKVLYLSCEDRADVLHWRLARICAQEGIDPAELAGLRVVDLVGHDGILYRRDPSLGSHVTAAYGELQRIIEQTGAEVVFVDGVSDAFGGSENDRGEIKAFVNALVALIGTNGAVVLIHHVNRATASAGVTSEGYSGSTGWHNSVRARWYLQPEIERTDEGAAPTGDLILSLQKSNLGRSDQSMRFRWDDTAHMFLAEKPARFDRHLRDEEEQDGIVAALREVIERGDYVPAAAQGPRTAHHVLAATESLPDSLKSRGARRRFWRHLETLRRIGVVREGSMRRANRHVVATLELSSTPDAGCVNASNTEIQIATQSDAGASAPNASHSHGGYRGCARAHDHDFALDDSGHVIPCHGCQGDGCPACADTGLTLKQESRA